jgi:hypothetical protein
MAAIRRGQEEKLVPVEVAAVKAMLEPQTEPALPMVEAIQAQAPSKAFSTPQMASDFPRETLS